MNEEAPAPGRNATATVALVLGIVSVVVASIPLLGTVAALPIAIGALVFGIRALRKVRAEHVGGRVRAIVGIILGSLVIAFAIVALIIIGMWVTQDQVLAVRLVVFLE